MLFVVIIDKTRIFENISAFKFVLPCISRVMVRNGCEGNGGGHYVITVEPLVSGHPWDRLEVSAYEGLKFQKELKGQEQ